MSVSFLQPHQRTNLLILFGAALLFWSGLAALLPTLPLYVRDVGGTDQQIGLVIGAFAIGLLTSRSWLGRLADQRSRKTVLLIGMAVSAVAPLGYLLIQSIPLLMAIRAFHGISIAAFATAYLTLVVDLSPPQNRGELIGYMSLVNPIGLAVGPAAGGFLLDIAGYPPVFLGSSALGLIGLFCTLQVQEVPIHAHQRAKEAPSEGFWSLLNSARIRIPTLVMLLVGLAFGALTTFAPLAIQQSGVAINVGWFYTAAAIASFTVRLSAGRLSDRWGRGLFITLSLSIYASSLLMLAIATTDVKVLLAGTLEGLGFGLMIPMIAAMMADRSYPHERGRVFGLCMGGFDLGIAIAAPLAGTLAAWLDYRGLFILGSGLVLLGLIVFLTQSGKNLELSVRYACGLGRDTYAIPESKL